MSTNKTGFEQLVGNTPLVYIKSASDKAGCQIYGKCEFLNPGGSIKDRAALWLIKNAEKDGILVRGKPGIVIEATGGNTGIGLALVAKVFGYECVIVAPNAISQEKRDIIRQAGAILIEVEPNPYTSPNHYVKYTKRLVDNIRNCDKYKKYNIFYSSQWENLNNQLGHIEGMER